MNTDSLARALGWFSLGLGAAELFAPRLVGHVAGLPNHQTLLRTMGLREIVNGVGLLGARDRTPWLWARVAGDAIDLSLLGLAARTAPRQNRTHLGSAAALVAGVTALDLLASVTTSRRERPRDRMPPRVPVANRPALAAPPPQPATPVRA